jgi:hypothetical protein
MVLHHNFDKSGRSRNAIFRQGRLEPRAIARSAVELFGPAVGAGIASVELLGAPVLKLSDGSASGGDSLHDHGSFLAKQDQHLKGGTSPCAASLHLHGAAC